MKLLFRIWFLRRRLQYLRRVKYWHQRCAAAHTARADALWKETAHTLGELCVLETEI